MDFIENLMQHKGDYSKSETKVYHYVIGNLEDLETFTITKIAQLSQTSTSAVLRFCQTLGYKGFKDFRYAAVDYLHHHHKKESVDTFDDMTDNYSSIINRFKNIDRSNVNQLIDIILSYKRLHIFGVQLSSLPARFLYMGLQDLGISSHFAGDLNSGAHLTNIIGEEDTLIMFSVTGDDANYRNSLSAIQNNMPKNSFLITLNENAPASKYFPKTNTLPGNLFSKQSIVDTQSVPIIFVEILLNLIHHKMK